mmetsp:Transcript_13928/g.33761  ORF Transcript_13928/g.33761 Transcript_13928/m.33761 type:complete len:232 (-) Transcript_13928:278-973(-)
MHDGPIRLLLLRLPLERPEERGGTLWRGSSPRRSSQPPRGRVVGGWQRWSAPYSSSRLLRWRLRHMVDLRTIPREHPPTPPPPLRHVRLLLHPPPLAPARQGHIRIRAQAPSSSEGAIPRQYRCGERSSARVLPRRVQPRPRIATRREGHAHHSGISRHGRLLGRGDAVHSVGGDTRGIESHEARRRGARSPARAAAVVGIVVLRGRRRRRWGRYQRHERRSGRRRMDGVR